MNAWLGCDVIQNDPHSQNDIGKRFNKFLLTNNFTVVNALKSGKGLFTRYRNRQGQLEKSIIDFDGVCKRLLTEMGIATKGEYKITNYAGSKNERRAVNSVHVTLILKINLNVLPQKPQRVEVFEFHNKDRQKLFRKKISETKDFTDCFRVCCHC